MTATDIEVTMADFKEVRALFDGTADALKQFAALTEDEKAALPAAAQAGIDSLAAACQGILAQPRDLTPYGSVIIEWGPPRGEGRAMPGWDTSIYDTATGDQILTVSHIRIVEADANRFITADLTMFADESGNPSATPHQRDGETIAGVFRFNVSEMRVRPEPCACGSTHPEGYECTQQAPESALPPGSECAP